MVTIDLDAVLDNAYAQNKETTLTSVIALKCNPSEQQSPRRKRRYSTSTRSNSSRSSKTIISSPGRMPLPTIDESDTEMLISKSDSHNSRPWTELQPISSSGEHEDQLLDDDIEQGQTNRLSRDESGHDGIEDVAFAEEEVSSTSDTDFSDGEVTVAGDFSLEEQDEHRQQQHKKNRHNNRPLRSSISNGINGHRQGRTTNDRVRQSNDPRSYENMTDGYHKHRRLLCYTTVIIFFAACVTTLALLLPSSSRSHIVDTSVSSDPGVVQMESIFLTAGGDIYVDKFNQTWFNDEAYATIPGNVSFQHCSPIRQTKDDKLYCSERYFPAVDSTDGNIGDSSWNIVGQYDIPVTTTDRIQVVLHFVERFYTAAKERVFDVIVEGEVMALSYDILSATNGETHTATYLATTTTVTDGNLTIAFVLGASAFPKINAIEIHHYSVAKDPESLIVPDEGTDWSQVSPPNASNTLNSPTSVPKKANGTVSGNSQPEDEPQTSGAVFVDDSNSTDEILAWSENWSSP